MACNAYETALIVRGLSVAASRLYFDLNQEKPREHYDDLTHQALAGVLMALEDITATLPDKVDDQELTARAEGKAEVNAAATP